MEIQDKYLSVENTQEGDIITFADAGERAVIKGQMGKDRNVINFKVNNGRYELLYTPGTSANKVFMKAWGRETDNWVNKKFQVKHLKQLSFGKELTIIFPVIMEAK